MESVRLKLNMNEKSLAFISAMLPLAAIAQINYDDLSFTAVPELNLSSINPGSLRLSWSTNYPGYALESAPAPVGTTCESVTNVPVTAGSEFTLELLATEALRFFRLKTQ